MGMGNMGGGDMGMGNPLTGESQPITSSSQGRTSALVIVAVIIILAVMFALLRRRRHVVGHQIHGDPICEVAFENPIYDMGERDCGDLSTLDASSSAEEAQCSLYSDVPVGFGHQSEESEEAVHGNGTQEALYDNVSEPPPDYGDPPNFTAAEFGAATYADIEDDANAQDTTGYIEFEPEMDGEGHDGDHASGHEYEYGMGESPYMDIEAGDSAMLF